MASKLSREEILDVTDNLKDVFRYGPWWQRLIIIVVPVALVLGVLWIRPLPSEIPEKLKFVDSSMNAYFEDGAVRYLSDTYLATTKKGKEQAWTKKRWKRHLQETFADYRKKKIRFERETTHKSFRWVGLSTLVETVSVKRTLTRGKKVLGQTEGDIELTWTKNDIGWFVTEMEFQELPKSD